MPNLETSNIQGVNELRVAINHYFDRDYRFRTRELPALCHALAHQCDEAQGFYFSRPVLPQQFAKLLQTGIAKAASTE